MSVKQQENTPQLEIETPEIQERLTDKFSHIQSVIQTLCKELKTVEGELKNLKSLYMKELKTKKKRKERKNTSANGFVKPCTLSKEMSEFLELKNNEMISRPQVTKMISAYIKKNNLQNPENGSYFKADKKLEKLLGKPVHLLVSSSPEKGTGYSYFNLSKYLKEKHHFISPNEVKTTK
jgi:chromatin remodeling complex protein RSC6